MRSLRAIGIAAAVVVAFALLPTTGQTTAILTFVPGSTGGSAPAINDNGEIVSFMNRLFIASIVAVFAVISTGAIAQKSTGGAPNNPKVDATNLSSSRSNVHGTAAPNGSECVAQPGKPCPPQQQPAPQAKGEPNVVLTTAPTNNSRAVGTQGISGK